MWSGSDPTGTAYTGSSTPAFVTIRPDQLRDPNLPGSQRSLRGWFDASAFAPPRLGQFGSAAKGVIKGPGVNVWHLGVFWRIAVTEKVNVRMELTATNAFNHPNWSNPRTNISQTGGIGVISRGCYRVAPKAIWTGRHSGPGLWTTSSISLSPDVAAAP